MRLGNRQLRILDPPLFWRKVILLIVFSAAFIPLKAYKLEREFELYVLFLLLLHVYFVFILIYRVRWKVLAANRRSFILRLLAIAFFIAVLAKNRTGATLNEFLVFLAIALVIHVGLLFSLTLVAESPPQAETSPAE